MKSIVIAISGPPGSGKSTHAKIIADKINLRYFSTGKHFREIAERMGLKLSEFHKIAEKDPKYDFEIDQMTLKEAEGGNVVLDGHLTGWIAKDKADIKIYLTAPIEERAKRIAKRDEKSFEESLKDIIYREKSNRMRYKKYYGIDVNDISIYDVILNTGKWDVEDVSSTLIYLIKKYLEKRNSF
ncbi:MAG: AAA family ATPase [Candidatus Methanomethylicia archaeon]